MNIELYAKNNKSTPHAPKSHNLDYIAQKMNLERTEHQKRFIRNGIRDGSLFQHK